MNPFSFNKNKEEVKNCEKGEFVLNKKLNLKKKFLAGLAVPLLSSMFCVEGLGFAVHCSAPRNTDEQNVENTPADFCSCSNGVSSSTPSIWHGEYFANEDSSIIRMTVDMGTLGQSVVLRISKKYLESLDGGSLSSIFTYYEGLNYLDVSGCDNLRKVDVTSLENRQNKVQIILPMNTEVQGAYLEVGRHEGKGIKCISIGGKNEQ